MADEIKLTFPDSMSREEAEEYIREVKPYDEKRHRLIQLDIKIDGAEVVLEPHYDSVIRVRRITGYLSTINRFNDAKRAEEAARVAHVGTGE